MKCKVLLMTLLLVGLALGVASNAFGAAGALTVTATADPTGTIAPGDTTHVVQAVTVTADAAGGNTIATVVVDGSVGGGTDMIAAEITRVAIYNDVTGVGTFDFNSTLVMQKTGADVTTFVGGSLIFDVPDVALGASETKKYLVVIDVATTLDDTHSIDASVTVTGTAAGVMTPLAGGNDDNVVITATHLQFVAAGFNTEVATNAEILIDAQTLLNAVDDYGNISKTFAEAVQFTAVDYNNTSTSLLGTLTAMGGDGGTAGGVDVTLGAGDNILFVTGSVTTDFTATPAINTLFSLKSNTAGNVTIIAQTLTSKLEGSTTIRNDAAAATLTNVVSTRGIEVYDTNHNGHIDHVTIFFNAPISGASAGLTNNLAFSVAGYTLTGTPVLSFDAGGAGIRNAGLYGVTLTLTEKTAYDTNAKPDVTYTASAGALTGVDGGTMGNIVSAGAVEVDKARPIMLSIKTNDLNENGIIDGVRMIFSEPVSNLTANSAQVLTSGDVGTASVALSTKLQGGVTDTPLSLNGQVTETLPSNTVTVEVIETIPNSGLLPVLLFNENDVTSPSYSIRDAATSATGSFDANYLVSTFTTYAADTAKDINVLDGVSPIITDVTTGDSNANGQIDNLVVTFSENMNPVNSYSYAGVSGFSTVSTFGSAGTYATTAGAVASNVITYTITPSGARIYDTEAKPTIYYNSTAGNLRDANGFELADYGPGGRSVDSAYLIDGAAPVIVSLATGDNLTDDDYAGASAFESTGSNGRLDTAVITFSEQVKTANYATASSAANIDAAIAQFALRHEDGTAAGVVGALTKLLASGPGDALAVPTWSDDPVSSGDTSTHLTVYFKEVTFANLDNTGLSRNHGDTGVLPDYQYILGGVDDQIKDMNDVALAIVGPVATYTVDTAKPFIVDGIGKTYGASAFSNVITVDDSMAIAVSDSFNGDGYIDSFKLFFSEDVRWLSANSGVDSIAPAFTVNVALNNSSITLNGGVDANLNGTVTIDDKNHTTNSVIVYGTSQKIGDRWDTGTTPTLTFDGSAIVYDISNIGAGAQYEPGVDNVMAAFTAKPSYDGAAPVIVRATGSVADTKVLVQFSEDVYKNVGGDAFDVAVVPLGNAVFKYDDFNSWGAKNVTAVAVEKISSSSLRVAVDSTLVLSDVEQDKVHVVGSAVVFDNANAVETGLADNSATGDAASKPAGLMITINDTIAPWITAAVTVDSDGDGLIDHIRFTFSENVKDASITGYNGINTLSDDVASMWVVGGGYDGTAKFNFFENTVDGKAAAFAAGEPIFTDNGANDSVMYLRLDEANVPASVTGLPGTTAFKPTVTWTAVDLSDFKPNLLNTVSTDPTAVNGTVTDDVGPILMSAVTTTTTTLDVKFSEDITLASVVSGDFLWTMGTDGANWQTYVARITRPSAGVARLEVNPTDGTWKSDMAGTLAFAGGQSVSDAQAVPVAGLGSGDNASAVALYGTSATVFAVATSAANRTITVGIVDDSNSGVTKAALNSIAANAKINNTNVTAVWFNGTATAGDTVAVKLVDFDGAEVVTTVVANGVGNFTGAIDASPLVNGPVTIKAGKSVGGVVAAWYVGADYTKNTITVGAPSDFVATDVPDDNGGFVDVSFTKSADDTDAAQFYKVDSYVIQGLKNGLWYTVSTLQPDGNIDTTYRAANVFVGAGFDSLRVNAHTMLVAKVTADAPDALSSAYVVGTGTAIDNLVPGAFVSLATDGSLGEGVNVTWVAPADHGLFNQMYNIWGVDKYEVYRRVVGETEYTLVGTVNAGVFEYVDAITNGATVYEYLVKAVDGAQIVETDISKASASKSADWTGDGSIGLGDLILFGSHWNQTSADADFLTNFDLNKDNVINLSDLILLGNVWGTTVAKVAKTAETPVANVALNMVATANANNSVFFVTINASDVADVNGVDFTLSYDAAKFDFVPGSVTGLDENFSFVKSDQAGIVNIVSVYLNEAFSGTITLGFTPIGVNSSMNVEMVNAIVAINGVESLANNAETVMLKAIPSVYSLAQNFPNPFNPTTTIEYSIPTTGNVSLVIYNIAGQKVRTLVNGTQSASFYKVVWDGKNDNGMSVATGTYFYKLVSGNYSKIVKMTLMK